MGLSWPIFPLLHKVPSPVSGFMILLALLDHHPICGIPRIIKVWSLHLELRCREHGEPSPLHTEVAHIMLSRKAIVGGRRGHKLHGVDVLYRPCDKVIARGRAVEIVGGWCWPSRVIDVQWLNSNRCCRCMLCQEKRECGAMPPFGMLWTRTRRGTGW